MMKCSICINTYNQSKALALTLESILRQEIPFEHEVIVADDGSTDDTSKVCLAAGKAVRYVWLNHPEIRGPAVARNTACRMATGEVLVIQHGDIFHPHRDNIAKLVGQLRQGEFLVSRIKHKDAGAGGQGSRPGLPSREHPILYLGAVWREDYYAIGGCDEEFTGLGSEDVWLWQCLVYGQKLSWRLADGVEGWHQPHPRSGRTHNRPAMKELRKQKQADAEAGKIPFCASGGPWKL